MLEVLVIANVTAKLGAVIDGVLLEFFHGFPYDLAMLAVFVTFVRELTEVNAVLKNLVYWLQKVATSLAMGTADVVARSDTGLSRSVESVLLSLLHLSSVSFSLLW